MATTATATSGGDDGGDRRRTMNKRTSEKEMNADFEHLTDTETKAKKKNVQIVWSVSCSKIHKYTNRKDDFSNCIRFR